MRIEEQSKSGGWEVSTWEASTWGVKKGSEKGEWDWFGRPAVRGRGKEGERRRERIEMGATEGEAES